MWPFNSRRARPTSAPGRRSRFRPKLEALEERTVLSHTVNVPVAVNAQVLAYVKAHVAHVVGDGQCATLAADAVQYARGVPYSALGPTGPNASYVWGKLVTTLTPMHGNTSAIAPGDILQFTNVIEVDTMVVHNANGSTRTYTSTQTPTHHTAIVTSVGGTAHNDLQVLQANVKLYDGESLTAQHQVQGGTYWGGTSTVTINYPQYHMSITVTHTMMSGTIEVYQPHRMVAVILPSIPVFHW